jgi:uncharacterized Tic20 family protein
MTSKPASHADLARARDSDSDIRLATFGYLGAIVLGPVIPLVVYAVGSRRSPFVRYHAATAANLSLTAMLYGLCCLILGGLLALDSTTVAFVVAIPVGLMIWASMLRYLIQGVISANRGERREMPDWICAHIVR